MKNMNRTLVAVMVSTTLATVAGSAAAKQVRSQAEAMQHAATDMQQEEMSYVDERVKETKASRDMKGMGSDSNTWITLTGEVTEVDSGFLTLDYGDGSIFVELDSTQLDADAYRELEGEDIMVTAYLDDSMLTEQRITAQSIVIDGMQTTYMADGIDKQMADMYLTAASALDMDDEEIIVVGTVQSVAEEAIQLKVGESMLTVELDDLDELPPRDKSGVLNLAKGERVRVTGEMEDDFFNTFTVEAESVMKTNS